MFEKVAFIFVTFKQSVKKHKYTFCVNAVPSGGTATIVAFILIFLTSSLYNHSFATVYILRAVFYIYTESSVLQKLHNVFSYVCRS